MSKHKIISFVKSGVRLAGYGLGFYACEYQFWLELAFLILIFSEAIGIYEEFGEK